MAGRPTTWTATGVGDVVPFPSRPSKFAPAHQTELSFSTAQVVEKPQAICTARRWQAPSAQKSVERQSPSEAQLVLQALAEQTKSPEQGCAVGATHEPALQVPCPTYSVPEQVGPEPQLPPG